MNNKLVTAAVIAVIAIASVAAVMLGKQNMQSSAGKDSEHTAMKPDNKASQPSASEVQETNKVSYKDFEVVPKTIKVKAGTTVTWTNEDTAKHDVTPDKETDEFKASELFGKGETHEVTFNTPGTYTYYCSPHPYMKGTIEVTE